MKRWRNGLPGALVAFAIGVALITVLTFLLNGPEQRTASVKAPAPVPKTLTFVEPNGQKCVTRNPPALGECVAQALKATGKLKTLAPVKITARQQCADWSIYQGSYPRTDGLHCVIVQAAYGENTERSVYSQINDLKAHHIQYGVYDFGEPDIPAGSELAYIHRLVPAAPLGYWFDAEVSGVFWRSCEFTSEAARLHISIYGVFSYPGGYVAGGGRHCSGWLWASEWGVPAAYAFGGYPTSAIKLWQYCGTCSRYNVTTDLDVDQGLLALASPPRPPVSVSALEKTRAKIAALEARHHCRQPPYHAALPTNWEHACHVWVPQGRRLDKEIKARGGRV